MRLIVACVDEVEYSWFDVFAIFDEGHVSDVVEEEYFGMTRYHGLGDGDLEGYAVVVLAVDEECGYLEVAENGDA